MLVAHADDETIFGAHALLSSPGWLIVCSTCQDPARADSCLRSAELKEIAARTGAQTLLWDFPDLWNGTKVPWTDEMLVDMRARVDELLAQHNFSKILTHNAKGEYGHPHHRQLHSILTTTEAARGKLWVFSKRERAWEPKKLAAIYSLLSNYKSQYHAISRLSGWIALQDSMPFSSL